MRLFDWLRASTALTNASGVHADKVGEFGLMATLMLHERVPAIATKQRGGVEACAYWHKID
jgi:phosphoglycerate dehydrogenase-like enzyme